MTAAACYGTTSQQRADTMISKLIAWLEANAYPDDVVPGAVWHDRGQQWEVTNYSDLARYIEEKS